ncbi:MAG: type II toxin-antitoxin system PemK/MazF family toxin [Caldilineaceae bacterium]|nr:type II toxin-antitoxin system PemK/MazF family toxin [Caldilineaceae bacterium]
MRRGEIRWCSLQPPDKRRPVVILTRNSAIGYLANLTVAPITSTVRDIPTQVHLTPEVDGVTAICAISLDNLQTISKRQIGPLIATLSLSKVEAVEAAIVFALGMDTFVARTF